MTATIQLSSLQIIAIFLFVGILYHYIQTNKYNKLIIGSILIGGILGASLGLIVTTNMQVVLRIILICIVSFLIGGVIAVSLKKTLKRRAKPNLE